jgi:signal transduction histidine kinase
MIVRENFEQDLWSLFDIPPPEKGGVSRYLETILTHCQRWFSATDASAFVVNHDGIFTLKACVGTLVHPDTKIEVGVGIAGKALQTGSAVLLHHSASRNKNSSRSIESSMVIPLILNDKNLGILNLSRSAGSAKFRKRDLLKANKLARHIALAVGNWKLVGDIKLAHDQIFSVFDTLDVAVTVLSNKKIHFSNPWAQARFPGEDLSSMLSDLPPLVSSAIESVIQTAQNGQKSSQTLSHNQLTYSVTASPLPGIEIENDVILVIEDFTETLQITKEQSRLLRLAEIGQMTAAIAHEIRNPLTGIRSAAQMITEDPEHSVELAGMIEEEAMKLNELCTQFLDFAKPVEPNLTVSDLSNLLEKVAFSLQRDFRNQNKTLALEIQSELPINMDAHQIERVARNLIINAMQACEPGGIVKLTADSAGFSIKDNGCGMSEETVQKLFVPFFTTKPQGTGLGLSQCKKLIESHNAQIKVKSTLGKGTEFQIIFADNSNVQTYLEAA